MRALASRRGLAEHLQLCVVDDFLSPVGHNRFPHLLLTITEAVGPEHTGFWVQLARGGVPSVPFPWCPLSPQVSGSLSLRDYPEPSVPLCRDNHTWVDQRALTTHGSHGPPEQSALDDDKFCYAQRVVSKC